MPERLMLDASLLLHRATARNVRLAFEEDVAIEPGEVVVPETIYRIAHGEQVYLDQLLEVYGPRRRTAAASAEDLTWLREHEILPYSPASEGIFDLEDPFEILLGVTDENEVLSLLLQEWVFLTSESWIAARRHTTFNYFKKAGAVAIELPKEAFDALTRRALKIPQTSAAAP